MHFEVFSLKDSSKWKAALKSFPNNLTDIYFYPEYYMSWQECDFGEPLCVYAKIGHVEVLYPFLKKEISEYRLDDHYFDISSAYGYGGAITSNSDSDKEKHIFSDLISDWCGEQKVIAEFIREYPGATFRLIDKTKRSIVRYNLWVDTSIDKEDIWNALPGKALRNVRYAQKNGLTVNIDEDLKTIDTFYKLYCETAIDRHFERFYHFSESYFQGIKKFLFGKTVIINAVEQSHIIASVLCFHSGNKFTYHLGASLPQKRHLRPNDLLYWAMIQESNKRGYEWLNLGGGMSTNRSDSLFLFKKKYGKCEIPIYIETCVHNELVYGEVCRIWELQNPQLQAKKGNYFLKYREHN